MINPMDLSNKLILITGASSGIGKETAKHLSKLGAKIILIARNEEKLINTVKEMQGNFHKFYSFDLREIDKIEELISKIVQENGKLDGLVHCAGIAPMKPLTYTQYEFVHDIMLSSLYAFIELVRIYSKKNNNNGGSIISMSSISSDRGEKSKIAYCASKAAIDGAIRAIAVEIAEKNIRVNSIKAGFIKTPMYDSFIEIVGEQRGQELEKEYPLGFGNPLDIASAMAFLLSDASKYITGTSLFVDGGFLAKE